VEIRAGVLREQGLSAPFAESCPIRIETVELAAPGPGEVLVQIAAAGLCHSDLSAIQGLRPRRLPAVPGHEASGIVVECGPGVDRIAPGDHVVMVFVASCRHCEYCNQGRANLCQSSWKARVNGTLTTGSRRLSRGAEMLNHWSGVSCFAEYAVVTPASLVRIDEDVPLTVASVLGCAVITGVGAVLNCAGLRPGQSAAVFGLGGVGLSAVMGAVLAGAARVVAVDIRPEKLTLAYALGATDVVDGGTTDVAGQIRELTGGGPDFAFDMAGVPATVQSAYECVRPGGAVIIAALPDPSQTLAVPISKHVAEEKRLIGCYMGGGDAQREIPKLVSLFRAARLPIDKLQSRRLELDDINAGFDRLQRGEAVRDLVTFKM
jgi:alcohol dehydrogenase